MERRSSLVSVPITFACGSEDEDGLCGVNRSASVSHGRSPCHVGVGLEFELTYSGGMHSVGFSE